MHAYEGSLEKAGVAVGIEGGDKLAEKPGPMPKDAHPAPKGTCREAEQ